MCNPACVIHETSDEKLIRHQFATIKSTQLSTDANVSKRIYDFAVTLHGKPTRCFHYCESPDGPLRQWYHNSRNRASRKSAESIGGCSIPDRPEKFSFLREEWEGVFSFAVAAVNLLIGSPRDAAISRKRGTGLDRRSGGGAGGAEETEVDQ